MPHNTWILLREDHARCSRILERLHRDANAKMVFLVNRSGEQIAAVGEVAGVDTTALASLTAGNVAATHGLARLIGEQEFSILFHEGVHEHLHISVIAGGGILLVLFDGRTSLGLVRLRVKRAVGELGAILEEIGARAGSSCDAPLVPSALLRSLTDEEIDALLR